jgi:hypothetical protein
MFNNPKTDVKLLFNKNFELKLLRIYITYTFNKEFLKICLNKLELNTREKYFQRLIKSLSCLNIIYNKVILCEKLLKLSDIIKSEI